MARPIGYIGYYPGERIPRPPGGGKPQPPITYDLNVLGQAIEEMEIAVGNIPEWTAERFTEAIKSNLKATIYGGTLDASSLAAYDEGELEEELSEISGTAGFAVNLNPADIAKDPKKWAGKLVSGAYSELTSLSDIESKKRKAVWMGIVGLAENGDTVIRDLTKRRALRRGGVKDYRDIDVHPLKLTGIAGYEKEGRALAEKITDFQGNIRTVVSRDKNFDEVLRTSFSGTREVLARNVGRLEGDNQGFVLSFLSEIDLVQNIGSVDEDAKDTIKAAVRLWGLSAEENPVDKNGNPIRIEDSLGKLQGKIDKSRAQIKLMTEGKERLTETQLSLLGILDGHGNEVADNPYVKALIGRTGPILGESEAKKLNPYIRRCERSLNRIEKEIAKPAGRGNAALFVRNLSAAASDLTGRGSRGNYNSVERTGLRKLGDKFVRGSVSGIAGDERLEEIIRPVDEGGGQYIRRTRTLLPTLEKDRQFYAVDDFMDILYDDSFYSKFLWVTKINPRLQALTPDYYVKQFMVKMHYFGLVIDEKSIIGPNGEPIEPKFFLFKWANKMVDKSQKKGGAFANKFSIGIEGFGKHVVRGENRFGAVQNLSKLIKSGDLSANKMMLLMNAEGIGAVKGFLIGAGLSADNLNAEKFLKFQAWAKENARRLGIDWKNGEHMMEVVRGLAAYDNNQIRNIGIGITKAYRGKLEQFVQKLSVLQNKVFTSFLGKAAGKLVSWKMAISVAVSEAVMDALGIATGGAAFLLKPLQLLLQAAIRIALDIGEKIVMSIVKADFEELSKFLDKSLANVIKLLGQVTAAITLLAIIPFFLMAVLITTISPENNAKVGGIGAEGVVGEDPGPPGSRPSIPPGTCFFETGGYLSYPSFGRKSPDRTEGFVPGCAGYAYYGHGTRHYGWCYNNPWKLQGTNGYPGCSGCPTSALNGKCVPPSPTSGCTCCPNNNQKEHFGFAADFASFDTGLVHLPKIGGPDEENGSVWTWYVSDMGTESSAGEWITVSRTDWESNHYRLHVLHLFRSIAIKTGDKLDAGAYLGSASGSGGHVHVEFEYNGDILRPDYLFCTENRNYW